MSRPSGSRRGGCRADNCTADQYQNTHSFIHSISWLNSFESDDTQHINHPQTSNDHMTNNFCRKMENQSKSEQSSFFHFYRKCRGDILSTLEWFLKGLMHSMGSSTYFNSRGTSSIIPFMAYFVLDLNFRLKWNRFVTRGPAGNYICRNIADSTVGQPPCSYSYWINGMKQKKNIVPDLWFS